MDASPGPWTFGVEPLPQAVEAAARLRRVTGLVLALERGDPAVDRLIDALDVAERALPRPVDPRPRIGAATEGRAYVDHSRDVGAYNPAFPEYGIDVDGDEATGTVNFPLVYEGPPGIVHGGFLALFFDAAIQHHNCDVGVAGRTTGLELRYRRPTPLLTDLRFALTRAVGDGRIRSTGQLFDGDTLLCEARMNAVEGDRSALPAVSPRSR